MESRTRLSKLIFVVLTATSPGLGAGGGGGGVHCKAMM